MRPGRGREGAQPDKRRAERDTPLYRAIQVDARHMKG
jgi:hypothetical protein